MAAALAVLLVLAFFVVRRRLRRAAGRNDATDAAVAAAPHHWRGPSRLPGRPALRGPSSIPRPVPAVRAAPPAPPEGPSS